MKRVAIGVDIGGTNTAIGMVDDLGNVMVKDNIATPSHGNVDLYIEDLSLAINELIKSVKLVNPEIEILGIGIGAPNGNYYAGTIEYVLDKDGKYYFIEMNTRVQVEHPVTEMVTGLDLVKEQIRAAAGKTLKIKQSEIKISSHSIECRINAEDSERLAPSPGTITAYHLPGGMGVRVDSFVYDQYKVLPYYDSMIGKLIVHAPTRADAIAKMRQALDEFVVEGIKTNIAFHKKILSSKKFREASYDTHFLEEFLPKYE